MSAECIARRVSPASGTPGSRALFLVGGSGFLGTALVASLSGRWDGELWAVARRPPDGAPAGVRCAAIDVRDVEALTAALPAGSAVVNLAYGRDGGLDANLEMAGAVAHACLRRSADRLVHISTAVVAGLARGEWVTETTPCRPADAYQRTKLAVEGELVRTVAGRMPLVVLRPTAVLGWGGANLRSLARRLLHGSRAANYLRSSLSARRTLHLVPVETVVAAIELALLRPLPVDPELYLVADDEAPENRFRELERRLLPALGKADYRVPPLPLPLWCLETLLRVSGRRVLRAGMRFSSARLRGIGFEPPIGLGDAVDEYGRRAALELR